MSIFCFPNDYLMLASVSRGAQSKRDAPLEAIDGTPIVDMKPVLPDRQTHHATTSVTRGMFGLPHDYRMRMEEAS